MLGWTAGSPSMVGGLVLFWAGCLPNMRLVIVLWASRCRSCDDDWTLACSRSRSAASQYETYKFSVVMDLFAPWKSNHLDYRDKEPPCLCLSHSGLVVSACSPRLSSIQTSPYFENTIYTKLLYYYNVVFSSSVSWYDRSSNSWYQLSGCVRNVSYVI